MTVEKIKKEVERMLSSVIRRHDSADAADVRIYYGGAYSCLRDLLDFIGEKDNEDMD